MRNLRITATLIAFCLVSPALPSQAEESVARDVITRMRPTPIAQAIREQAIAARPLERPALQRQVSTSDCRRGPGRIVLGAAVGAVGGLFAGGYLGAKIEGDRCHCDDPGLTGALIGAPIGAVAGGVLGGLCLF